MTFPPPSGAAGDSSRPRDVVVDDDVRRFMSQALACARRAADEGEVPVGAVLVRDGRVVAEGWNRSETLADPAAHAELQALRRAAALARNHRLPGSTLIVTLEPCLMCFGALLEARVGTLVFGASDSARGAASLWKAGHLARYPAADLAIVEGVAQAECAGLLHEFFAGRRSRRPAAPGRALPPSDASTDGSTDG